jgi:hypothetical protein
MLCSFAGSHDDGTVCTTSVSRQRTTTTHSPVSPPLPSPPPLTITHHYSPPRYVVTLLPSQTTTTHHYSPLLTAIITRLSWPRNAHATVTTAAPPPKLPRFIRLAVRLMKTSRGRPGRSQCPLRGSATSTRWLPMPRVSAVSLLRCVRECVCASRW